MKISNGYDIRGWLVVRNPLPFMMFIFFYLMALLHLGNEEEVEKALEEMFPEEVSCNRLMTIPDKTLINLQEIKTTSPAVIGNHCRITGNIVSSSLSMGNYVTLFGSVHTNGEISMGAGSTIHGNIVSKDIVKIGRDCRVLGKITADSVIMHETAQVDGILTTSKETTIEQDELAGMNEMGMKLFYGFTLLEHA